MTTAAKAEDRAQDQRDGNVSAYRQDVPLTRRKLSPDRPWHTQTEPGSPSRYLVVRRREDTDPTTSFLTATTLIYAIGAGITAAAGTRLALQLILV